MSLYSIDIKINTHINLSPWTAGVRACGRAPSMRAWGGGAASTEGVMLRPVPRRLPFALRNYRTKLWV